MKMAEMSWGLGVKNLIKNIDLFMYFTLIFFYHVERYMQNRVINKCLNKRGLCAPSGCIHIGALNVPELNKILLVFNNNNLYI